jgi:undecaprenyl-diphosphatase
MAIWEAIILGIIEGITEFLPISSTGHLTIAEKIMGFSIDDPDITAFTAIIQIGAVLATLLYFRKEIKRLLTAFFRGLFSSDSRNTHDYHYAWAILLGAIPIGIIGFLFKDQIESVIRSLWFVGFALLLWSGVMWYADHKGSHKRSENQVTRKDTLIIGITQCLALIPGISRSGATMSAGLLLGFNRVAVTKLSFFLSIPVLLAAGLFEFISEFSNISSGIGWEPTIIATVVSFFVAYAAIAWLLRYISHNSYALFIFYRVILGALILILLTTGAISAT